LRSHVATSKVSQFVIPLMFKLVPIWYQFNKLEIAFCDIKFKVTICDLDFEVSISNFKKLGRWMGDWGKLFGFRFRRCPPQILAD
jgi:hypothetical protein